MFTDSGHVGWGQACLAKFGAQKIGLVKSKQGMGSEVAGWRGARAILFLPAPYTARPPLGHNGVQASLQHSSTGGPAPLPSRALLLIRRLCDVHLLLLGGPWTRGREDAHWHLGRHRHNHTQTQAHIPLSLCDLVQLSVEIAHQTLSSC